VLHHTPYEFISSPIEVAEVLEPPLDHLLDEDNLELETFSVDGVVRLMPAYHFDGHRIWGATARMLQELLELLRGSPERLAAIRGERQG
jgi:hypothetical protein